MPCLDLRIDGYSYRIDSPDVEMCSRWLADLLTMFPPTSATHLQLHVYPFIVPDPKNPYNGPGIPDWETHTKRWESISATSPADAVQQFAARLAAQATAIRNGE